MNESLKTEDDLANCKDEPFHLSDSIQPFGFLIAVSSVEWLIERVSLKVVQWLETTPADMLGRPLAAVLNDKIVHDIRGALQTSVMGAAPARLFGIELRNGLTCDIAVHVVESSIVIEFEPTIAERPLTPLSWSGTCSRACIWPMTIELCSGRLPATCGH